MVNQNQNINLKTTDMKSTVSKVGSQSSKNSNQRREFLKLTGMAVIGLGFLISCSNDDDMMMTDPNVFDL